jgi:ATP-independent RNA helicase DbpA
MNTDFSTLPLHPPLLQNLKTLGFVEMTPVQAQSLPSLLEGKDVLAQADTGSGKTVAFGLSLLQRLEVERYRVQSLVLCPTRELAQQVSKEIRRLARRVHNVKVLELCGGLPVGPQIGSLEHGAHIVVGTPGRVLHHLKLHTLTLRQLNTLVLDEADRMLDMGFEEELNAILKRCPEDKQTLLFSATYPDTIREMSQALQKDAVMVSVESKVMEESIQQFCCEVEADTEKAEALLSILYRERPTSCLVFCKTRRGSDELANLLRQEGFTALAIHGDLEQRKRQEILVRFANQSCTILVATDVAARGLDIADLELVVTWDLPQDPDVHTHRIGRTGRGGQKGLAVSLVTPKDMFVLKKIEKNLGRTIERMTPIFPEVIEPLRPAMVTLCLDGGKKKKVRPGDILGALTRDAGLPGKKVGKIDIFEHLSYIAVHRSIARAALEHLQRGKVKGRFFKARRV